MYISGSVYFYYLEYSNINLNYEIDKIRERWELKEKRKRVCEREKEREQVKEREREQVKEKNFVISQVFSWIRGNDREGRE